MIDIEHRYLNAPTFEEYLASVEENRELWHAIHGRVRLPADLLERARGVRDRRYLLALAEDWCGDAVNLLPVIARFAEALPNVELRVLSRDENPDLMDAHLTDGRSRSIPVVIVLDEEFEEIGWWGPRPEEIQSWVVDNLDLPSDDRYRTVRGWYVRDRGRTTLEEIVELLEPAGVAC